MLKYRIDSITEGGGNTVRASHTVYVQLYDDEAPGIVLGKFCVSYVSQAEFETELKRKTDKYLASVSSAKSIEDNIKAAFTAIEPQIGG